MNYTRLRVINGAGLIFYYTAGNYPKAAARHTHIILKAACRYMTPEELYLDLAVAARS